jgi:hypothetical protein
MDKPRSIKCLSKNQKVYYTYSLEKKAEQSKIHYQNGGKNDKNRAMFLKGIGRFMPRLKSLMDYKITEFEESLKNSLKNEGPERTAEIEVHYTKVDRLRKGEITTKSAFKW